MNIDYDAIEQLHVQALAYERASIERCKTVFPGAIALDLGFCDGLWTYAMLQAGAKKVIGFDINCYARFKRFLGDDRFEGVIARVGEFVLDDFIAEKKIEPSFIKMDIEGDEIAGLEGMKNYLRRKKPSMMIEVHGGGSDVIVKMLEKYMERRPSGENYILNHLYHLYYLPKDI